MFLYLPVMEKYWQQHQMWDGTYDFEDLLNVHKLINVKSTVYSTVIDNAKSKIKTT